jgi:cell filamentation protein
MTVALYDAFEDPYAYPGTQVLINRLDLRDPGTLARFELEMTSLRADEPLPQGGFDPAHYRAVHHHLFQDVYEWAGEYRTVRTGKSGHAFCYPEHIPGQMDQLFESIDRGAVFAGRKRKEFIAASARFLAELNAIHPFREGNGRTRLAFFGLIGDLANRPLAFERLDVRTFLPAMIESFSGHLAPLSIELEKLL